MRKLASVQEVANIIPIFDKNGEEANSIELVQINGWQCVVKKGIFKQGDLGVYFEIDSFLTEDNEKLKKEISALIEAKGSCFLGKKGIRIKTIKLLGQLSQGLFLPLTILENPNQVSEGDDVTEELGVIKYEKIVAIKSNNNSQQQFNHKPFPEFIRKTDCERIQNLVVSDFLNPLFMLEKFETTVKYDGSSMTIYAMKNEDREIVGEICSRNIVVDVENYPDSEHAVVGSPILEVLKDYVRNHNINIAIQGEIIGPKVNGNFEKVTSNEFHIFNIYDIDKGKYFSLEERKKLYQSLYDFFVERGIKLNFVKEIQLPYETFLEITGLSQEEYFDLLDKLKQPNEELRQQTKDIVRSKIRQIQTFFLEKADGEGYKNKYREGIVMKTANGNFIWKAISNAYLLKHE